MKNYLPSILIGLVLGIASPISYATLITFEGGTNGTAVGSTYSGSGVIFDNAFFANNPYGSANGSHTWASGEAVSGYNGPGSVSVTGHFVGVTDMVSAQSIYPDGGTTSTLTVYGVGNVLLGSNSVGGGSSGPLMVSAAGITSFVFSWSGADDVVGIDNFNFNSPVSNDAPEPASLALLGLGLAGLGFSRRRKQKLAA